MTHRNSPPISRAHPKFLRHGSSIPWAAYRPSTTRTRAVTFLTVVIEGLELSGRRAVDSGHRTVSDAETDLVAVASERAEPAAC